jgi:hypothetical protein
MIYFISFFPDCQIPPKDLSLKMLHRSVLGYLMLPHGFICYFFFTPSSIKNISKEAFRCVGPA